MIAYVQRRTGELVSFDAQRIQHAIFAAAQSVGGTDKQMSVDLTKKVVAYLIDHFDGGIPKVEEIQDLVELALIKNGHAKTARAFIMYRARQEGYREKEKDILLEKMQKHEISVTLENGTSAPFDMEKIISSVTAAADNLSKIDVHAVVLDACKNLYNGAKISEIEMAVINSAKGKIEKHTQYSYLSARLLLQGMYKVVFGESVYENLSGMQKSYESKFADFLKYGVKNNLLDKRLESEFDVKAIAAAIKPERDLLFQFLGIQTVNDRYLLKTVTRPQHIVELPQWMWMRVAMGLALSEKEDKTKWAIEFYNTLSQMNLVSSTPTLFNSGTTHSQMSSCYVNTVEDSLSGIFKTYADNAQLSKYAGGIGTDWTNVRATNAKIEGTNGASQGIIPFLKIFNDVALAVNQGGKRKGAMAAYLEVWHGDIEEFLEAKKNTGDERRRLHDINTACWISDLFMKRVREKGKWTLFSPNETPELHDLYGKAFEEKYEEYEKLGVPSAKTVEATVIWRKLLTMLYETGHPWITFKDAMNVRNPQSHVGVIHNSNLCTEIALNTSLDETAVCNLASINLSKMIENGKLDEKKIAETVKMGMRMLDNVVDENFYPTVEAKNSNMKHRPVGFGMMGYQDALYQVGIAFDSEENLNFADLSMEMVSYYAIQASSELAAEKGAYSTFKGSKWDNGIFPYDSLDLYEKERGVLVEVDRQITMDWDKLKKQVKTNGMRNACCMAIAPTATISNIAGTTPCIEPTYKNIYMKENLSGSFVVMNKFLVEELEENGLWNENISNKLRYYNGSVQEITEIPEAIRAKYKETFEIEPEWIIKSAARRNKWIDQAASTNIFLKTTSGKILHDTYMGAWEAGLKTTYYLRSLAVSQVQKTVEIEGKQDDTDKLIVEKKPAATLAPVPAATPTTAPEVKFCRLDDPTCESCQ